MTNWRYRWDDPSSTRHHWRVASVLTKVPRACPRPPCMPSFSISYQKNVSRCVIFCIRSALCPTDNCQYDVNCHTQDNDIFLYRIHLDSHQFSRWKDDWVSTMLNSTMNCLTTKTLPLVAQSNMDSLAYEVVATSDPLRSRRKRGRQDRESVHEHITQPSMLSLSIRLLFS